LGAEAKVYPRSRAAAVTFIMAAVASHLRALASAVLLLIVSVTAAALDPAQPQQFTVGTEHSKLNIIVYGDVRFTNPDNHRVSNAAMRQEIVRKIADEKPDFVAFTGDVVLAGDNPNDWEVYRRETQPFRDAHLRFFTLPGNHDFSGDPKLVHYFAEFKDLHSDRWYTIRAANTLTLMLDSEADHKGGPQWQWIEKTLDSVPPDVDFVFLAMHHPPLTKSSPHFFLGGHTAREQEQELGAMIEAHAAKMRQKIIVFAGHVHNYERYTRSGVTYIVTGGGGATPYMIPRDPEDAYHEPGATYHFCKLTVDDNKLKLEMNRLDLKDASKPEWSVKDSFELEAPAKAKPAKKASR
jgi:acid phosphatase type 7